LIVGMFIVAENEELFSDKTNGERAYERAIGPKKLVVIPGIRHYGIYNEASEAVFRPGSVRLKVPSGFIDLQLFSPARGNPEYSFRTGFP